MPNVAGCDVVDFGCGTGRWLARLASRHPTSLRGIDDSIEMLQVAEKKCGLRAQLSCATLTDLPLPSQTADTALASFVLSYVEDLERFAMEAARVIRDGGHLLVSDMHPETAKQLNWKRGFRVGQTSAEPKTTQRSLEQVIATLTSAGFELELLMEPALGEAELRLFESERRLKDFEAARNRPAIYVLQLRRRARGYVSPVTIQSDDLHLVNASCALGPSERETASVFIGDGRIQALQSRSPDPRPMSPTIDLNGYMLLPGLINAHDHLEFALYPRLGSGPYGSATEWAQHIHQQDKKIIALHSQVPKWIRLWWGGIRNLLSGVTTVCHHNPLEETLLEKSFPVRVVTKYAWAHSLRFAPNLGTLLQDLNASEPFIIHACEGIDQDAFAELWRLDAMGALDPRTVLIHGLALDVAGVQLLNARGASLVVCPLSNSFLFATTHSRETLRSVERLALGSDSSLTSHGDLLDEVTYLYRHSSLAPEEIYPLALDNSSSILRLINGEGHMAPDGVADLIAVRDKGCSPAETLCSLSWQQVELVVLGGRIQLASDDVYRRLIQHLQTDLEPLYVNGELRWLRAPITRLLEETETILGHPRLNGRTLQRVPPGAPTYTERTPADGY